MLKYNAQCSGFRAKFDTIAILKLIIKHTFSENYLNQDKNYVYWSSRTKISILSFSLIRELQKEDAAISVRHPKRNA